MESENKRKKGEKKKRKENGDIESCCCCCRCFLVLVRTGVETHRAYCFHKTGDRVTTISAMNAAATVVEKPEFRRLTTA